MISGRIMRKTSTMKRLSLALFLLGTMPAAAADISRVMRENICDSMPDISAKIMKRRQQGASQDALTNSLSSAEVKSDLVYPHIYKKLVLEAVDDAYRYDVKENAADLEKQVYNFAVEQLMLCPSRFDLHYTVLVSLGYTE